MRVLFIITIQTCTLKQTSEDVETDRCVLDNEREERLPRTIMDLKTIRLLQEKRQNSFLVLHKAHLPSDLKLFTTDIWLNLVGLLLKQALVLQFIFAVGISLFVCLSFG